MKLNLKWTDMMTFTGSADGKQVDMDAKAPLGRGSAMTPKELVAAGLAGCTAMDVVALFKKHKQNMKTFDVDVDIETSIQGHPVVFTKAILTFKVTGEVTPEIFKESVVLSQTKYCGVSAMLAKAFPIHYRLVLNDQIILEGQSHFET